MTLSACRRLLYRLAAAIGDVQAIRKGPHAIVKRLARKQLWRTSGRWLNKLLR